MTDPVNPLGRFDLGFQEQIDFFRRKTNLGTQAWTDIWEAQHDRAFVVAGAMKADLLNEIRQAVDKAIATGTTLETFRREFRAITDRLGWPGTAGAGSTGGFNWRTKVIYETNLRTSYAAGREAQLADPGLQALLPYRRYVHNESVLHPRPMHLAWNGLTLPHDHPFWQTHSPPNGWGCRCRVTAVAGPRKGDATKPPAGWDDMLADTGAPPGIDKGWGYAPGASVRDELRALVEQKVAKLPEPLGKALEKDVGPAADIITVGTEKQIVWANKIREEYEQSIAKLEQMAKVNAAAAEAVSMVKAAYSGVINKVDARSWIDLRDYLTDGSVRAAVKDQMAGRELWIDTARRTWVSGNKPAWVKSVTGGEAKGKSGVGPGTGGGAKMTTDAGAIRAQIAKLESDLTTETEKNKRLLAMDRVQNEGGGGYSHYDTVQGATFEKYMPRLIELQKELFAAEWTPEVTASRRAAWNAEMAALQERGKQATTKILAEIQDRLGFTFGELKRALGK